MRRLFERLIPREEYDRNAIGVYVTHERPDAGWKYSCWPRTDKTIAFVNLLLTSKRRQSPYCKSYREEKEGGWSCLTSKERELNERAPTGYIHFELKNITIDENKSPLLASNRIAGITVYFYHLIRGRRLLAFSPHVPRLIEGGAYSRVALIRVNRVSLAGSWL